MQDQARDRRIGHSTPPNRPIEWQREWQRRTPRRRMSEQSRTVTSDRRVGPSAVPYQQVIGRTALLYRARTNEPTIVLPE